jgi:hypothetical protein
MSCLAHDKRFRSSFHGVINELRNEKCMSVSILRAMPNRCCTCHDENKEIVEPVIMKEQHQFMKLNNLIERVNREKQINPKLILSLNRFENLIEENRGSVSVLSESLSVKKQKQSSLSFDDSSSSSDSEQESLSVKKQKQSSSSDDDSSSSSSSSDAEDIIPMEISKTPIRYGKKRYQKTKKQNQKIKKISKPIKNGTFLFLPYTREGKTERKTSNSSLLDVAKQLQRNRFIGRNGRIAVLEKQYDVRINMITQKTSAQVTEALENAKKGLDKLKIHDNKKSMEISEKQEGEWVLIRSKKPQNQTNTDDIEQLVDELTSQWESCLNIRKRKNDESDDSVVFVRTKK